MKFKKKLKKMNTKPQCEWTVGCKNNVPDGHWHVQTNKNHSRFQKKCFTCVQCDPHQRLRSGKCGGLFFGKLKQPSDLVYIIRGTDRKKDAWYYILVDAEKESYFERAVGGDDDDNVELTHYGVILDSGFGVDPPRKVTQRIKKIYNI